MFSPYEELEYLADCLPEEGESVLLSREEGQLHCKPWQRDQFRDGIDDADLYGRLVQANELLAVAGQIPFWMTTAAFCWITILLFGVAGLGWGQWFLLPGIGVLLVIGCSQWIRHRQHRMFSERVRPMLQEEIWRRQTTLFALIAGVRQHAELRTLLDELIRWMPDRAGRSEVNSPD